MKSTWVLGCTASDRCSDGSNEVRHPPRLRSGSNGDSWLLGLRLWCAADSQCSSSVAESKHRRLLELQTDYCDIVVDLKDVSMVDREVMRFLARCETDGVKLENCARYIREWMEREKD